MSYNLIPISETDKSSIPNNVEVRDGDTRIISHQFPKTKSDIFENESMAMFSPDEGSPIIKIEQKS